MPEGIRTATNAAEEAEKLPDFAELERRKEALFKKIEGESLNLSEGEKTCVVSLVLSHSIKDGFDLAKRLGLDSFRFSEALGTLPPYKSKSFLRKFADFVESNKRYVPAPDFSIVFLSISSVMAGISPSQNHFSGQDMEEISRGPYAGEINDYYLNFIRNRRVAPQEALADERTQVEKTAEEHLVSMEAVLKESYYTGPIRKLLGVDTEEELEENGLPGVGYYKDEAGEEHAEWILRQNLITKKELDGLLQDEGIITETPEVKRVLREARYAPSKVVFEARKKEAEKRLVEQIRQSLLKRGYKEDEFEIKLNDETGQYEVVEKEEEGETEVGKENLKLKEDVQYVVEFNGKEIVLEQLKINDGGVYKLYTKNDWNKNVVVDPHGNTLESEEIGSIENVPGHEVFWCTDGYIYDGTKFTCSGYKPIIERDPIEVNAHLYWVGRSETKSNELCLIKDSDKKRLWISSNIPELSIVDDELVEIWESIPGSKTLWWDAENRFGPYDEIKLCENSKDKLIFYFKKGGKHFVYVDGEETELNTEVDKMLLVDNYICLHDKPFDHSYIYILKNGDTLGGHGQAPISNFTEIDGKLFFIENQSDDKRYIFWNNPITAESGEWVMSEQSFRKCKVNLKTKNNQVVGYRNSAFITDGERIVTVKYGEPQFEFDEMKFDGEVEVVNSGGKLFIIESLPDKKRVWEWSENLELTDREMRDLNLANAVASEDQDMIDQYFLQYYPEEVEKAAGEGFRAGLKKAVEQSKGVVRAINQTIKEAPELFLDTLRAKNDKPTEALMSEMFYYMFPEAREKRERALKEARERRSQGFSVFGGMEGGGGGRGEHYDYDPGFNSLVSMSEADFYEAVKEKRKVLEAREPLSQGDFIIHGIFGNWTGSGWSKVNVPISREVAEPAKETTFEFVDEKASATINLPKIVNAQIIKDRIRGIKGNGEEAPVEILEENNLGEVRVKKARGVKKIAYSQNVSEAPKTMAEITAGDYEKFRREFEKSFGDVMTKKIGDVGDELDIFIRGLKGKTPREQVIAIQEFCYEYGYYNLDKEVRDADSFEERLSIMEFRMDNLKKEKPELAGKKYAGICTDFASLTAALLRRAGFVSGIASGFAPEAGSMSVTTDRAHAVSYVLWPNPENKEGKPDLIVVDGTPASITPKILELEKKAVEARKETEAVAEKKLVELEKVLRTMDTEAIKKLSNGVLEQTLNAVLYGVKQSHVDVMSRVLNGSRYAGFDPLEMTRGNLADEIEFRKFLEEEIEKEREVPHENRGRRGEELFQMILDFSERFAKDKRIQGKGEVFDILDKIFEAAGGELDPIEKRAAVATVTYLRARKMR